MNAAAWVQLGVMIVQALLEYGPPLWGMILKIIRDLRGDKTLTDAEKIQAFRLQTTRAWIARKGKLPTEEQIQTAFVRGCRRVLA